MASCSMWHRIGSQEALLTFYHQNKIIMDSRKPIFITIMSIFLFYIFLLTSLDLEGKIIVHADMIVKTITIENPVRMEYNPYNGDIYVLHGSDEGGGSKYVSVISDSSNKVTKTILLGAGSTDMAFNPSNNCMYVITDISGNDPDRLYVVDSKTNTIIKKIDIPDHSQDIEYNPSNGHMYVASHDSDLSNGEISVVDYITHKVLKTLNVNNSPNDLEFNPGNNYVYVKGWNDALIIVDSKSNTIIEEIIVGLGENNYNDQLKFNPNDQDIYMTLGKKLAKIDSDSNKVSKSKPLSVFNSLEYNPYNGLLYAYNSKPSFNHYPIIWFDSIHKTYGIIQGGNNTEKMIYHAGNKQMYTVSTDPGNLFKIGSDSNAIIQSIPLTTGHKDITIVNPYVDIAISNQEDLVFDRLFDNNND
jgi:DNA-binding beta-propeller fold protein YncE